MYSSVQDTDILRPYRRGRSVLLPILILLYFSMIGWSVCVGRSQQLLLINGMITLKPVLYIYPICAHGLSMPQYESEGAKRVTTASAMFCSSSVFRWKITLAASLGVSQLLSPTSTQGFQNDQKHHQVACLLAGSTPLRGSHEAVSDPGGPYATCPQHG